MKRFLLFLVLMLCLVSWVSAEVRVASGVRPPAPTFDGYRTDSLVLRLSPETLARVNRQAFVRGRFGVEALDRLAERHRAAAVRPQFPGAKPRTYQGRVVDLGQWHRLTFAAEIDVPAVVADFQAAPGVLEAQPIGIHSVTAVPNDQYYVNQWHHPVINAPQAWEVEVGRAQVTVAILDTGVRYFHKDLGGSEASYDDPGPTKVAGNMWTNDLEKAGSPGTDDDGNGKVDDWVGWDFVEAAYFPRWPYRFVPMDGEDNTAADNDPRDFNGHGTHCAGIVAAITNNNSGLAGVAGGWLAGGLPAPAGNGVRIMPLRIGWSTRSPLLGEVGLVDMAYAAEAFYYAAQNGAKIASCSWGNSNSGGLGAAVDYFLAGGGLIFVAAGNDGKDKANYLCSRADIIKVAATDQNDLKAGFSNYGAWVSLSAPGVAIWSLVHNHSDPENDYLAAYSGTSMATPMAAAVAALIWSRNQSWTAAQVSERLLTSCDNIDALNPGYAGKLGAGRINAAAAVSAGPVEPQAGVEQMLTGRYKTKLRGGGFVAAATFNLGDTVIIRTRVVEPSGPVAGATVDLALSGPQSLALTTAATNADGWGEAAFPTAKPKGGNPGTPTGTYTATVTGVTASGHQWDGVAQSTSFLLQ